MKNFVGNCCWKGSASEFMAVPKCEWLRMMEMNYRLVTDHVLTTGEFESWADCNDVLKEVFASLPMKYLSLFLMFEAVIPDWNFSPEKPGAVKRIDVTIESDALFAALEFKRFAVNDFFPGWVKVPKSYQKLLKNSKVFGAGKIKRGALVLTNDSTDYVDDKWKCTVCTRGSLPRVLTRWFGGVI